MAPGLGATRKPQVIVFQYLITHYRVGVFETIAGSDEFDYTFCYGMKQGPRALRGVSEDLPFPSRYRRIWQLRLPFAQWPLYFQPAQMAAVLGRQYDVLISSVDFHDLSDVLAVLLARLTGKKIVAFGQGVPKDGRKNWNWQLRRLFARMVNAVLLYGRREYDFYARDRFNMDKVFTANNALDTCPARRLRNSITQADLDAFRAEKGLKGKRVLLYVGRLVRERLIRDKRLGEAVHAMPAILRKVPDAKLVLIGDGPERESLRALAARLGLAEAVDLPGAIYDEEVLARYYMSSELAVCPGAVGLLVNHAFVYGVPIVVNDSWWNGPEIAMVRPGRTGAFFKANDVEDFARCVVRLLRQPELLRHMGLECIRLIDEEYNENRMARGFDDVVRYALAH